MGRKLMPAIVGVILVLAVGCDSRRSAMEEMKARAVRRPKTETATTKTAKLPMQPQGAQVASRQPRATSAEKLEETGSSSSQPASNATVSQARRKSRRELEEERDANLAAQHKRRKPRRESEESKHTDAANVAVGKVAPVPPPVVEPDQKPPRVLQPQTAETLVAIQAAERRYDRATSPQQRAQVWKELDALRRSVLESSRPATQASSSSDDLSSLHANQLAEITSQFQFGNRNGNEVALLISSDMSTIIGAQSQVTSTSSNDGQIHCWDVLTGEMIQSWPIADRRVGVRALVFTPNEKAFLTTPHVGVYHLGSGEVSGPLGRGMVSISPRSAGADMRFVAVGVVGAPQAQERVLHLFRGEQATETLGGWDAFEAMASSVAFGNRTSRVAFAIRERGNHRLLLGEPGSLTANSVWQIEEYEHSRSWYSEDKRNRSTIPGITAMAFSPDDQFLIAYGCYQQRDYRATVWSLDWSRKTAKVLRDPVHSRSPLLREGESKPIRFIGNSYRAALETPKSVVIVDIKRGGYRVNEIELKKTRRGRPLTAFSPDNRWLAVGDDQGCVALWNLETGEEVPLTPSGRPAQSGPIAGLAFSNQNPITGTTDFLVTSGEENTIKLWSLAERIGGFATLGSLTHRQD